MKTFPMMVVGAGPEGSDLVVRAPFDGTEITSVPTEGSDAAMTALAVAHSRVHYRDNWLPCEKRVEILECTAQAMSAEAEELTINAAREGGKPLVDSRVESPAQSMESDSVSSTCARRPARKSQWA
jgi:acyl-CoA reductase-like NAD-dependent aldehyde dehydrogenase